MMIYISISAVIACILVVASAGVLLANPQTFRVHIWIKAVAYAVFLVAGAGAALAYSWASLGRPSVFLEVGAALLLNGIALLCAIFLYVHAIVIPASRKESK